MEAAVTQLIKTAIIKAGNRPAAFTAIAQRCPAAGTIRLFCISPQSPRQAPQAARWSYPQVWPPPRMALTVRGSSSGKARCLAHSFIKYLCGTCCVPGPVPPIHYPVSWLLSSTTPSAAQASASRSSQQLSIPLPPSRPPPPTSPWGSALSALQPLPLLVPPVREPFLGPAHPLL